MADLALSIRAADYGGLESVYRFVCSLESEKTDFTEFGKVFHRNLRSNNCRYIIAEFKGTPVGFVSLHLQEILHHVGLVGEIQELFVLEMARRRGVARALLNEVCRIASERQIAQLEVTSNISRREAQVFYEAHGFSATHRKYTLNSHRYTSTVAAIK